MAPTIWKAETSLIPMVGLLLFAAIVFGAGPAWAQFDCPLPEGVNPPVVPRVTAQQVQDGSATLTALALAVRDRWAAESPDTEVYVRCLIRQEGNAWRSGSTYLVQMGPDGRVRIHAKDISLSGRQLNPEIYVAVLQALGIDPAVLADPSAARAAFGAAVERDGGPFDVPAISGASGYAAAFRPAGLLSLRVLLAGFDLVESHLAPVAAEDMDYGDPAIAAKDVVDRATLKAYATGAAAYVASLLESGDSDAFSVARIALRHPDGPWRHDPVYVGLVERSSELIVFHGAFPDRFELRPGGVATNVATGELVFDQLIAAAESSPEGSFWLYRFDSPVDDTDSEDIPKLGYARIFTAYILLADGSTAPTDFFINSGFYLTADSVYVQRLLAALEEGQQSIMFAITTPQAGSAVTGDVVIAVESAPTDTVHFAYRLVGAADTPFTYAGAATNREGTASFAWDTLHLPDDDYEFVALYTEDDGQSVIHDTIEVTVDNVDDGGNGGGGCAAAPVLPGGGGSVDPTLPALAGLVLAWLTLGT